ncbi:hypothetical protein GKP14_06480 [Caproicibacterium lactatifermentans]|jgi:signal transduction histidine kinase|uniref:histidine kinase n=2 Tax=Caproicibacterium lactatifermentans TaxID=2666138 RepID=A0ABX6PWI3_9FIRM|nr:hypothetical protein GKP14_06480 [Caproicibacterium lactatifermentans]
MNAREVKTRMIKRQMDRSENPRVGWLSSRLSHKALVGLVLVAVLSGLIMCGCFLSYLRSSVDNLYNGIHTESSDSAKQAASFLMDCGGDYKALKSYAVAHSISCEVRDEKGELLFEYQSPQDNNCVVVSGSAKVTLPNQKGPLTIRTFSIPLKRQQISASISRSALVGLCVLDICIFIVVAVMLYLLVLAPIIRLRHTFREYYEHGVLPQRSTRQDELGKLQNTFADMVDVIESKAQSERRLIASVSHDIKTPLTSVMGYSERLVTSKKIPPEKQQQYLRNIHDKSIAIKNIIDEFDDYLEAGLHDTSPMYMMTLNDFCRTVKNEYQAELADAGVGLTIECESPASQFRCNYEHMRRFIGNLISNSIQHANAEPLKLRLACWRENEQIILSFSDNGQGVPPDILSHIFEPFFTTDRGRKVSGLGLAICENIIHTHGGTITAANQPAGGLQIQAHLPCINE